MVLLLVRLKMAETTFKDKLARIDFVGGFFFIAGTTSFLIAVSWGGSQYAWGSSRTLVPLIFGILGTMIAVGWEYRYAAEPFLRRSLFHSTSAIAAYGGSVAQGLLVSISYRLCLIRRCLSLTGSSALDSFMASYTIFRCTSHP